MKKLVVGASGTEYLVKVKYNSGRFNEEHILVSIYERREKTIFSFILPKFKMVDYYGFSTSSKCFDDVILAITKSVEKYEADSPIRKKIVTKREMKRTLESWNGNLKREKEYRDEI